ncbi:MAG TPA: CpsD/CapB family tyrosine-protein kinase [Acidimicrobiales bacterium]|nr:CpsD/CapB family tyrosine-protein kinase [Acidimicrobiales bacterium]
MPDRGVVKEFLLFSLAVALAQAGQRVVIVCCDLRRPRIHEFFGLSNAVGFTSVLLGDTPLSAAIQKVRGQERLAVLASGPIPPNPSELLSGRRTVEVLTAVQAEADIVLVDCPPVLPVTDAAVLSSRVDATLLVATAGETTRKENGQDHRAAVPCGRPHPRDRPQRRRRRGLLRLLVPLLYSSTPAGSRSDKNKVKAKAKKERAAQARL